MDSEIVRAEYLRLMEIEAQYECLKEQIGKQARKQDNEDYSLDWNLGFAACCSFLLREIYMMECAAATTERNEESP